MLIFLKYRFLFCTSGGRVGKISQSGDETGWDLKAGTWDLHRSAWNWTNFSVSNQIQRNYKGLKITVCMCSWGNYEQDTQRPKSQLPLLRSLEQKQGTAHAPCTQHHPGDGQTTSATPPARPLDLPLPSHHIRNQLAPLRERAREPVTCFRVLRHESQ